MGPKSREITPSEQWSHLMSAWDEAQQAHADAVRQLDEAKARDPGADTEIAALEARCAETERRRAELKAEIDRIIGEGRRARGTPGDPFLVGVLGDREAPADPPPEPSERPRSGAVKDRRRS